MDSQVPFRPDEFSDPSGSVFAVLVTHSIKNLPRRMCETYRCQSVNPLNDKLLILQTAVTQRTSSMGLAEQSSLPCLWLPLFFQLSPDGSACFYGCFSTQDLSRNSTAQPFLLLLNSNLFSPNRSRNRTDPVRHGGGRAACLVASV